MQFHAGGARSLDFSSASPSRDGRDWPHACGLAHDVSCCCRLTTRRASTLTVTPLENDGDVVDVEFDIRALSEKDFHGIKYLMQQLFWTVRCVLLSC